jgi:hypothetical protein
MPPILWETLLLYISATTNVVNMVLVTEWEEEGQAYPVQRPVYYVSDVLADAKTYYAQPQKIALCTPGHVEKALPLLPSPQDHGASILHGRRVDPQSRRQRQHS